MFDLKAVKQGLCASGEGIAFTMKTDNEWGMSIEVKQAVKIQMSRLGRTNGN